MKLYKLTGKGGCTKNNTHWDIGVTHEVTGVPELCTRTVLHAYTSPLLAAFMWPAHLSCSPEQFFVCEGEVVISDGTKVGCQKLTVIDTFELPELTNCQRIAFGILSALQVCKDKTYQQWASNWLTGKDRSAYAAAAAAANAARAAYANDAAAVYTNAARAAYANANDAAAVYANAAAANAVYANDAAAVYTNATAAYAAADAAAYAAKYAAKYAANAVTYTVYVADAVYPKLVIDFEQLAQEALKY